MYWAVSSLSLGIHAGAFALLEIFFHSLFGAYGEVRLRNILQLDFMLYVSCNRFAWLCENISIFIDQLIHKGCKSFTSIISYLMKLRNLQI